MRNLIYYILPLILFNCAPQKPDPKNDKYDGSAPVLVLNEETVSVNEFNRRIENLPEFAGNKLRTIEAKRAHLTGVAQFEVLAAHAANTGLAKDPEVVSALKIALQESHQQQDVEVSTEEIDAQMMLRRKETRFGLIQKNTNCSLQNDLQPMDVKTRLNAIKALPGWVSFSTRLPETAIASEQALIATLKKIGDYKFVNLENDSCQVVILTKIEIQEGDRLQVETELRAQKKAAFLKTLKK